MATCVQGWLGRIRRTCLQRRRGRRPLGRISRGSLCRASVTQRSTASLCRMPTHTSRCSHMCLLSMHSLHATSTLQLWMVAEDARRALCTFNPGAVHDFLAAMRDVVSSGLQISRHTRVTSWGHGQNSMHTARCARHCQPELGTRLEGGRPALLPVAWAHVGTRNFRDSVWAAALYRCIVTLMHPVAAAPAGRRCWHLLCVLVVRALWAFRAWPCLPLPAWDLQLPLCR